MGNTTSRTAVGQAPDFDVHQADPAAVSNFRSALAPAETQSKIETKREKAKKSLPGLSKLFHRADLFRLAGRAKRYQPFGNEAVRKGASEPEGRPPIGETAAPSVEAAKSYEPFAVADAQQAASSATWIAEDAHFPARAEPAAGRASPPNIPALGPAHTRAAEDLRRRAGQEGEAPRFELLPGAADGHRGGARPGSSEQVPDGGARPLLRGSSTGLDDADRFAEDVTSIISRHLDRYASDPRRAVLLDGVSEMRRSYGEDLEQLVGRSDKLAEAFSHFVHIAFGDAFEDALRIPNESADDLIARHQIPFASVRDDLRIHCYRASVGQWIKSENPSGWSTYAGMPLASQKKEMDLFQSHVESLSALKTAAVEKHGIDPEMFERLERGTSGWIIGDSILGD